MSSDDAFQLLGLDAKTATEADVKRAYATKLKQTRPDEDAAGFMRLRDSYDIARQIAKHRQLREARAAAKPAKPNVVHIGPTESPDDGHGYVDAETGIWLDETPVKQLAAKAIAWLRTSASDASLEACLEFWNGLLNEPCLEDPDQFAQFSSDMLCVVCHFSGCPKSGRARKEHVVPAWLYDDLVLLLEARFAWVGSQGKKSEKRLRKWIADLFTPLFERHGVAPDRPVSPAARKPNQRPADEMMERVEALISEAWRPFKIESWQEILDDERILAVDDFQEFSNLLRLFICRQTGMMVNTATPVKPGWMTDTVTRYLDDRLGWSRQTDRDFWSRQQQQWIYRLTNREEQVIKQAPVKRRIFVQPFETRELQPKLPWFLSPRYVLLAYLTFSVLRALTIYGGPG
jgi:hypothetical protein